MTQYLMFRVLSFFISVLFISFCFYLFYAKFANFESYVDTTESFRLSTLIPYLVEVCLVTTLFLYSIILMIGSFNNCIENIKAWLRVVACGIFYYCIVTILFQHKLVGFLYIMLACISWCIVFIYYHLLNVDNSLQALIQLPGPGSPPSDEIHEMIITNDLPPAYDTLKNFQETPPPSYMSAMSNNP